MSKAPAAPRSLLGALVLIGPLALTNACGDSAADPAAASSSVAAAFSSAAAAAASSSSAAARASSVAAHASSSAVAAGKAAEASRSAASEALASAAADARPTAKTRPAQGADQQGIAAAHLATLEAARAAGADLDAPGDESGKPCAADPQYANEKPIGLQPEVVAAWQTAVAQAKADGVTLCLNDGKRSRSQQVATYNSYVAQYGKAMADIYVLPPEKSAHVIGLAVDVQPLAGHNWLEATAGVLGFCRTYDNETWHFEYDAAFVTDGCPARTAHPGG